MQPEPVLICEGCGESICEEVFKKHIKQCSFFRGQALNWVKKLPKKSPLQLKFIIAELDVCRELLQQRIFESYEDSNYQTKEKQNTMMCEEEPPNRNTMGMEVDYSNEIVTCCKCKKKFYASYDTNSYTYIQQCWHLICKSCFQKYIEEKLAQNEGNFRCPMPGCETLIYRIQIQSILGRDEYRQMERKAFRKMFPNVIQCVNCHEEYQFSAGNPNDAPAKDNNGKVLSQKDKNHYAENRFVCPRPGCRTQQCKQCGTVPFHIAMTCAEFKQRSNMMKCRYCSEPITQKNRSRSDQQALIDICNGKQCQQLSKSACTKKLPCGHSCYGCKGEAVCLPCLHPQCSKENTLLNGQNADDYCAVCYVESLSASPCIRSGCGHIFHEKCLKKRYEIRWLTPRIFFNFCLCPLCKKWITVPVESSLNKQVNENYDLFQKIQGMSMERLKFEECDKDEKLKDPNSPYFEKPQDYAMAIYAYFQCFKCKNPYFGGRKNCAEAMGEQQAGGSFNPKELICPNCCDIPIENCSKHGKDFIQFKCKFCCSIAQWFCWGNTHFCQPCHKRQVDGDYVSKIPKQKLPKCQGPGKCPAGGNHGPNGEQKSLGCTICRNIKANGRNF